MTRIRSLFLSFNIFVKMFIKLEGYYIKTIFLISQLLILIHIDISTTISGHHQSGEQFKVKATDGELKND